MSIPIHITGATAGRTSRFAGIDASEMRSKSWAISGAVATVAASVIAAPSASARASGSGRREGKALGDQSAGRPRPEHDPGDRREAELPADVAPKRGLTSRVAAAASSGG